MVHQIILSSKKVFTQDNQIIGLSLRQFSFVLYEQAIGSYTHY